MKTLRIKADPEAAAKIMGSNRPFKIGDTFVVTQSLAEHFVWRDPNLFEVVEPIVQQQKAVATEPEEIKVAAPERNKMLGKGKKFKSKNLT